MSPKLILCLENIRPQINTSLRVGREVMEKQTNTFVAKTAGCILPVIVPLSGSELHSLISCMVFKKYIHSS